MQVCVTQAGLKPDYESNEGVDEVFKILGQMSVPAKPGYGSLHHPAARQNDKSLHVVAALDDFDAQGMVCSRDGCELMRDVAAVRLCQFQPRKAHADSAQNQPRAIAIPDAGRVDNDTQGQPMRVNKGAQLEALHLFADVVTPCVCLAFAASLLFCRPQGQAVDHTGCGPGLTTKLLTKLDVQMGPDGLSASVLLELAENILDRGTDGIDGSNVITHPLAKRDNL